MTDLQLRLRAFAALQPQGPRVIARDLAYVGMSYSRKLTEDQKRVRHVQAQQEYRRRLKERG